MRGKQRAHTRHQRSSPRAPESSGEALGTEQSPAGQPCACDSVHGVEILFPPLELSARGRWEQRHEDWATWGVPCPSSPGSRPGPQGHPVSRLPPPLHDHTSTSADTAVAGPGPAAPKKPSTLRPPLQAPPCPTAPERPQSSPPGPQQQDNLPNPPPSAPAQHQDRPSAFLHLLPPAPRLPPASF